MIERYEVTIDHLHYIKEETPVGDYFTIEDGGDRILLHDIVTHQPLQGSETPPGVLAQPSLWRGIDYLRQAGESNALAVQLMLGPHDAAADFTELHALYGPILEQAPIVALEMSSMKADNDTVSEIGFKPHLEDYPGRRAFQNAQLAWARSAGKMVLPCELAADDDSALGKGLIHVWGEVLEPLMQSETQPPEIKCAGAIIAEAAYQRTRQPAILARMGYFLSKLKEARYMPGRRIELPLILGNWHENDKYRLPELHVPVEVYEGRIGAPYDTEQWIALGKVITNLTYTSRAGLDELGVIPPYLDVGVGRRLMYSNSSG